MIGTCEWLEGNMGYEVEDWKWGEIHHAEFRHGMSVKAPLDKILNVQNKSTYYCLYYKL